MHIAALYRYPVKGFTREECDSLHILPGGRVAGDRVLGLRYNDAATPGDAWGPKVDFAALVNTPALAALRLKFDHDALRLRLQRADEVVFDGRLDEPGRRRFAAAVEQYLRTIEEGPLSLRADPFPLRVVGDAVTSRYQDREPGYTTLHGRGSLAALATTVGESAETTEKRFRSNIAVDGVDAWAEQGWVGRGVRIGEVEFDVANPVARCLATHAHPDTGKRDLAIMKTLLGLFRSERPTFAIMMTSERGGRIRVGDGIQVLD